MFAESATPTPSRTVDGSDDMEEMNRQSGCLGCVNWVHALRCKYRPNAATRLFFSTMAVTRIPRGYALIIFSVLINFLL